MSSKTQRTIPMETSEGGGATENKYDRQLRLWETHGQLALLNARILVLGSGPTATEFLKNMILPGTGRQGVDNEGNKINGIISIVDDVKVTKRDLGNNFFVRASSLGRYRADVVRKNLQELNPDDTKVVSDLKNIDELITSHPNYFDDFSIVIGTQLSRKSSLCLDKICRAKGIPLILGKINGFIGYVRNSVLIHEVVESKPSTGTVHRLHARDPWPELIQLANKVSVDVATQDTIGNRLKMHQEVPWILLIVNKIQKMKAELGEKFDVDELCSQFSKKREFLRNLCKDSENFIEPLNKEKFEAGIKVRRSDHLFSFSLFLLTPLTSISLP